jgi:succinyl-CoA synthetase beta subunit
MDIEEVSAKTPEKIGSIAIDPALGFQAFHARAISKVLGIKDPELQKQVAAIGANLYRLFLEKDCSMVEINPLILTSDNRVVALDAKINFDDNAMFRHKDILEMRDLSEENPAELEASKFGLSYIALSGTVGCMVNGAGLAMSTMDIIKLYGESPANFLDVGGGATRENVTAAFKIITSDPSVKAILVNIFGGIMKCDIIAEGIIAAVKDTGLKVPLVVRLEGTNVDKGKEILAKSGLKITPAENLKDAGEKIAKAARGQH